MEQFTALRLFISVVDAGGFSAGGEALGVSTSVVSRQIAALEAELGVRLLKRSTRTVELTEVGTSYLARVRRLLLELEDANTSLKGPAAAAAGKLRTAAPTAIGLTLIAPAIADFMAANSHVAIHLDLLDRRVDADEEDYDLVLRLDEDMGTKLVQIEEGLFASPAYIAHHGRPHGPADLGKHRALYLANRQEWNLRGGIAEKPTMQFSANRLEALKTLCLAGQGITLLPLFLVRTETERGELVQLLDGFEPKSSTLAMVTSPLRHETAASRLFKTYLETRFRRLRL